MSQQDSGQERTERPTPKRLDDARKKGQVLRSREFNTLLCMLGASAAVYLVGDELGAAIASATRRALTLERELAYDKALAIARATQAMRDALLLQVPLFAVMAAMCVVGPALLGGIRFSSESLELKLDRLDPVQGIARMFSPNALAEVAKSLLKLGWLGLIALIVGQAIQVDVLSLGRLPVTAAVQQALALLAFALVMLSIALLPIAAMDAPHQIWRHLGRLRMTRQEVRDELKETEGNPELKNRVRQQQRALAQRRMMQEVPLADVVITNPTHFAVALRYDPRGAGAPVVIAKGADRVAERIRALALGNDVPLFEAPPLARALYWSTELGHTIPAGLYVAVARVLAYVYQLRAAAHPYAAPPRPTDLPVPDEFLARERR